MVAVGYPHLKDSENGPDGHGDHTNNISKAKQYKYYVGYSNGFAESIATMARAQCKMQLRQRQRTGVTAVLH